ncbi:hypothetical protein [Paraburkholderia sp. Ac-20347]|uniref:hypothetical protein n=1 Tax=Paraburkholderia sp. Ac-20347 TaxID=2703892 RepID=UPI0019812778|nr:hypothetical protein [Paraburkholderia sp. Ac-20347]MBN3810360.1 hypothetical protein [Paraburkholderia sp. Ac-20347]
MRASWTMRAALLLGLLVACAAFQTALAPWLGAWRAAPAVLALGAAGGLGFVAWCRAQPAFIEIGTDRFAAFARSGACLADGRLIGASQWGAALLALVVEEGARRKTLLIAADSVDAETFRVLAVTARSAAGR